MGAADEDLRVASPEGKCVGRPRARVALCFFGVNRALQHTVASIRQRIFAPLDAACVEYDVFFHTYSLREIANNPRSNEVNARLPSACDEAALLGPRVARYTVTDQDEFDEGMDYAAVTRHRGVYPDKNTYKNICRQLESLRRVTLSWLQEVRAKARSSGSPAPATLFGDGAATATGASPPNATSYYDSVVYLRPDLQYENALNVSELLALRDGELLVPYWHTWGGANDRLAAAKPATAAVWGTRLKWLKEYTRTKPLHAEAYLKWVIDRHRLKTRPLTLIGARIRANGAMFPRDACLKHCTLELRAFCSTVDCPLVAFGRDHAAGAAGTATQGNLSSSFRAAAAAAASREESATPP